MGDAIKSNRRSAALFKSLSGCAAIVAVLSSLTIMGLSGPGQPDESHIHQHNAHGVVWYLTDIQEQMENVAIGVLIAAFAVGVALALASQWFKRRADQETQKQLLIDEFGPKNSN